MRHPDEQLIALGIQQPWAELILRGVKRVEVRSFTTKIRGPVYLYTSRMFAPGTAAAAMREQHQFGDDLPRGLLVGTVDIVDCRPAVADDSASACIPAGMLENRFSWLLKNPQRLANPLPARYSPFGPWFYPFQRRGTTSRRRRPHGGD